VLSNGTPIIPLIKAEQTFYLKAMKNPPFLNTVNVIHEKL